jgi:DNA-binding beta-propeller fold protein YncE
LGGIAHVQLHTTKDENDVAQVGNLRHTYSLREETMKTRTWIISLILIFTGSWPAMTQDTSEPVATAPGTDARWRPAMTQDASEPHLSAGLANMAVVVNGGTERSLSVLDPATNTVLGPFLEGQLGAVGAMLVDVVVTPDGNTAIVSAFPDRILFFIDLRAMPPVLLGSVMLPIFPIDLTLSPDGRFVLATSGAGITNVVSVDVTNRTVVSNLMLRGGGQAQAVAMSGATILAADFAGARVHVLRLSPTGMLIQPSDGPIPVDGQPNNIVFSPDGRTALVLNARTPDGMASSDTVTILRIDGTRVTRAGTIMGLPGFQTGAAFTPDGRRALVLSLAPRPDRLSVLQVDGPGMVRDTGQRVDLLTDMLAFFGIDVIAVSPDGTKAFVGNSGFNGLISRVTVIDLTRTPPVIVGTIPTPIPFGIAFPGAP